KEIWRFKASNYGVAGGIPLVHNDVLYISSRDGIFFALTPEGKEIWRFRAGGPIIAQFPRIYKDKIIFGCEDGNMYFLNMEGKEIGRFKTGGRIYGRFLMYEGKIYFGSWDCYFYCVDADTMEEVWRTPTSSMVQSKLPPVHEVFEVEVKKETHVEDAITEEKYKSKKKEETVSLSDYHVTSEYSSESEYKQKSDYDTSFVMFEGNMEVENIWISDSKDLNPETLMQK
ncbi:MAG: PQQ-like beta-propeller repeat protein, partial [Candidatus Aenigmarchaeota archaeon]|nr:PQQ-like beta-propeller repeat protein [Candidatus Aenigmarchaeota archaeon]